MVTNYILLYSWIGACNTVVTREAPSSNWWKQMKRHSETLGRVRQKTGRFQGQEELRASKEHSPHILKDHRDSQRLNWQSWTLFEFKLGPLNICSGCIAGCSFVNANSMCGVCLTFFCSLDPSPLTGLPHLTLIWRYVSSIAFSMRDIQVIVQAIAQV